MGLSNKLSCETGSFSYCHKPHRFLQPEVFEAFFFCAGTLGCTVCLAPQLFLLGCPRVNVGLTRPPAGPLPCCVSSVPWLSVSAPPTPLDECFFFNSLGVGLTYTVQFSGSSRCFLFVVVPLLVVCGSKVYLLTPQS